MRETRPENPKGSSRCVPGCRASLSGTQKTTLCECPCVVFLKEHSTVAGELATQRNNSGIGPPELMLFTGNMGPRMVVCGSSRRRLFCWLMQTANLQP